MSADRFLPYLAVFLIFKSSGKVLLCRRANTGHGDGSYSFVAGHVDGGESFVEAAMREAKEEAGVTVKESDLNLAYILHFQRTDRTYIQIYFEVETWEGEIQNMELDKCDDLSWFDTADLPQNTLDYIRFVLKKIEYGKNFGRLGFL